MFSLIYRKANVSLTLRKKWWVLPIEEADGLIVLCIRRSLRRDVLIMYRLKPISVIGTAVPSGTAHHTHNRSVKTGLRNRSNRLRAVNPALRLIHTSHLLDVNYCGNYSLNNGLYCTRQTHSHLLFGQLSHGLIFCDCMD